VSGDPGRIAQETRFDSLTIDTAAGLRFGFAPKPVECGLGLRVGDGRVFPELNFTLPPMALEASTWADAVAHYREIGAMIERASRRLHLPGLMVEFELLPPMTENAAWGAEITRLLGEHLHRLVDGIPSALRVTPVDLRDMERPPRLRRGRAWDLLRGSLEACAVAGAHLLSIESVGGKEVHDEALMYGDVEGILFALGVLAPRDVQFLWREIVAICAEHGIVAGGDSACGFANTAMQLASQGMLPEVLAAMVRAASAVRTLVSLECGAVGPTKDCAYEGPVIKAITGTPIAMEGKSASCAHFSPIGNVAAAMCDLWSNESVQNVRLLSGSAPEAFLELLAYDCRLFNQAIDKGTAAVYQSLLVDSDVGLSPQALVLSPESTLRLARAIVREPSWYRMTLAAARESVAIMDEALSDGRLSLPDSELRWLRRIRTALEGLPDAEGPFIDQVAGRYAHRFAMDSYGL
jgi:methanol--5-hydroxybenzimidazolylcobamide Co-methyltransferase